MVAVWGSGGVVDLIHVLSVKPVTCHDMRVHKSPDVGVFAAGNHSVSCESSSPVIGHVYTLQHQDL